MDWLDFEFLRMNLYILYNRLLEVGRKLDRNDAVALGKCAEYLVKLGEVSFKKERFL